MTQAPSLRHRSRGAEVSLSDVRVLQEVVARTLENDSAILENICAIR